MQSKLIKLSKLKSNTGQIEGLPKNPRILKDDKYKKLVKSIQEDPEMLSLREVIAYDNDGELVVIAGNMRLKACKEAGLDEVPTKILPKDTPADKLKRYTIKDNNSFGEWSYDDLANEWDAEELDEWGLDTPDDWGEDKEVEEDEAPEVDESEPPKSKLGEVYQLGRHRVMCADSTVRENVEKLMDGNKADMVFTDPPYGVSFQSNMRTKSEKFEILKNDNTILDFLPAIKGVCDGFIYVCTTWRVLDIWTELFEKYFDITNMIIWSKGGGGMGDLLKTYSTDYEIIIVANNGKEIIGRRYGSVWELNKKDVTKMSKKELLDIALDVQNYSSIWKQNKDASSSYLHPTQKPVGLSARAIQSSTEEGMAALDVFLGSGSTLIACEQTDRTCYGMELDEKYVDVVRKRWAKYVYPDRWEEEWDSLTPAIE